MLIRDYLVNIKFSCRKAVFFQYFIIREMFHISEPAFEIFPIWLILIFPFGRVFVNRRIFFRISELAFKVFPIWFILISPFGNKEDFFPHEYFVNE